MDPLSGSSLRVRNIYSAFGTFIAILPALFYALTHTTYFGEVAKIQAMQLLFGLCVVLGAPALLLRMKNFTTWIPMAVMLVCAVHASVTVRMHPALSDYGNDKYKYLLVVLFLGFAYTPYLIAPYPKRARVFLFSTYAIAIVFCVVSLTFGSSVDNARTSSVGLNPGIMSRMCLTAAGIAWVQLITTGHRWHWFFVALGFIAAAKTGTRGPMIAFTLAVTYVSFFVLSRRRFTQLMIAEIVFLVIGFGAILMMPEEISGRFRLDAILYEGDGKSGGRGDLFTVTLAILRDHVWGIGFGNFYTYHGLITVPHNLFLEAAVEMSLAWGLILLGYVTASLIVMTKLVSRHRQWIDAAFLFLLVYQGINALNGGEATIQSLILYSSCGYAFVRAGNLRKIEKNTRLVKATPDGTSI